MIYGDVSCVLLFRLKFKEFKMKMECYEVKRLIENSLFGIKSIWLPITEICNIIKEYRKNENYICFGNIRAYDNLLLFLLDNLDVIKNNFEEIEDFIQYDSDLIRAIKVILNIDFTSNVPEYQIIDDENTIQSVNKYLAILDFNYNESTSLEEVILEFNRLVSELHKAYLKNDGKRVKKISTRMKMLINLFYANENIEDRIVLSERFFMNNLYDFLLFFFKQNTVNASLDRPVF